MLTEVPLKNQKPQEMSSNVRSRALDALSALADLNQRTVTGLIEFSSAAALESLRAYTELQTAAVEAARNTTETKGDAGEPLAWYRRGVQTAVDDTQRLLKLFEKNAQIVGQSAERQQSAAERVGKAIREAFEVYAERMRDTYRRN
jgi:hypothetical protein